MDELQNKQGRNQIKVICFGVPPQAFAEPTVRCVA